MSRRLAGYAIVFDQLSVDLGGFKERIAPRAVDRALAPGVDIRALWSHDPAIVLGRTTAGTLRLTADRTGLHVVIDMPSWADPYLETIGRSDVTGMSFAFHVLADAWAYEGGAPVRTVLDMAVSEVSVVTFPAYPGTSVQTGTRATARGMPRGVPLAVLERWIDRHQRPHVAAR